MNIGFTYSIINRLMVRFFNILLKRILSTTKFYIFFNKPTMLTIFLTNFNFTLLTLIIINLLFKIVIITTIKIFQSP